MAVGVCLHDYVGAVEAQAAVPTWVEHRIRKLLHAHMTELLPAFLLDRSLLLSVHFDQHVQSNFFPLVESALGYI